MAEIRHLARAPITEALADFRVSLSPNFKPEAFQALKDRLRDRYPAVEEHRFFQTSFKFEIKQGRAMPPGPTSTGLRGYFFRSEDGRDVAQFRVDGFTYNRLAPYTSWDEIRPEALRLWELYLEIAAPEKLDRVALRYINRIRLAPAGDLSEHLEVMPAFFPGAPDHLVTFLTRVTSHDPETGNFANVAQALERDTDPAAAIVILDIDVYRTSGLELETAKV
ncbi:MAG: TIGR04255 family protein, partial [Gemmatimonadetes bacterium]|nr:TIGR04255 family protein [Gemmatimonadota bacterium]